MSPCISAITAAELEYGVVASGADAERNRAALARFVQGEVPVAPFDGAAARVYGAVRWASRERRRDAPGIPRCGSDARRG